MLFELINQCGDKYLFPINLQIDDLDSVNVTIDGGEIVCEGQPVTLTANASGGVGPYVYNWSTGETTQSISFIPTSSQTYSVTITDDCLRQSASATKTVTIPVYPPLTLSTTSDIFEICPYVTRDLVATPSGGSGGYSYVWTNENSSEIGIDSLITITPSETTFYTILVTDFCGDTISKRINYSISSPPLILTMSPDALICPLDSATVFVTASGGYGQYYYNWIQTGATTPSITVNPEFTTTYTVSVSDECQTFKVEGKVTVNVIEPVANFAISSHTLFEDLPITFQNLTTGGLTYQWTFGDGNSSILVHPNNTYTDPGTYYITLIATNEIGCKDTITKPITIQEEYWIYVPNSFTPDGDQFNNTFGAKTVNIKELEVLIYNRWGQLVFESDEVRFRWDGTYNGFPVQDGTYTYKIQYTTRQDIKEVIVGHVNVLR